MFSKYFLSFSACLFIILMITFEEEMFLTSIKPSLSICYFMDQAFDFIPKKSLPKEQRLVLYIFF